MRNEPAHRFIKVTIIWRKIRFLISEQCDESFCFRCGWNNFLYECVIRAVYHIFLYILCIVCIVNLLPGRDFRDSGDLFLLITFIKMKTNADFFLFLKKIYFNFFCCCCCLPRKSTVQGFNGIVQFFGLTVVVFFFEEHSLFISVINENIMKSLSIVR